MIYYDQLSEPFTVRQGESMRMMLAARLSLNIVLSLKLSRGIAVAGEEASSNVS